MVKKRNVLFLFPWWNLILSVVWVNQIVCQGDDGVTLRIALCSSSSSSSTSYVRLQAALAAPISTFCPTTRFTASCLSGYFLVKSNENQMEIRSCCTDSDVWFVISRGIWVSNWCHFLHTCSSAHLLVLSSWRGFSKGILCLSVDIPMNLLKGSLLCKIHFANVF